MMVIYFILFLKRIKAMDWVVENDAYVVPTRTISDFVSIPNCIGLDDGLKPFKKSRLIHVFVHEI